MKKVRPLFVVLVVLVLLVAAGAAIYFGLFGEKDTRALATSTYNYTSNGFLSEKADGDYNAIMTYLNKLDTTLTSSEDKIELENFKDGYTAYLNVSEFFQREAPFMKVSKVYGKNKGAIQKKLSTAQKNADKFIDQIKKNEKITDGSEYWQALAWIDCKDYMKNLLINTIDAYNLFADVYSGSVKSDLLNNDYSNIMFYALKDLSVALKENYNSQAKCGENLRKFTALYFTKAGETQILKYAYTDNDSGSSFRATVLDIKSKGKESACYAAFLTNLLAEGGV